jgi:L-rhamnose isomerase/sugar isomerase
MPNSTPSPERLFSLLDHFQIEVPSWGFADTGTRFGKFVQPAAARSIDEKITDAGQVHKYTAAAPTVAVHALWDFPHGAKDVTGPIETAKKNGVRIGTINPNLFQDQAYKFGSACSPDAPARDMADRHCLDCIELTKAVNPSGGGAWSLWFADGTNYPGQDDILTRKKLMQAALRRWHDATPAGMTMYVEYKPFEPAFYHTDVADWGMAAAFCRHAGPRAKVLVDTGHHLPGTNIEHIVAFLIDEGLLGGFHFNDRKYADDDLTIGSIDPYAVFRIFHEIRSAEEIHGHNVGSIAYTVDQSHNLKPKIEAMIQTVVHAQELFAKACLVDRKKLRDLQVRKDIVGAETLLRDAFYTDVRGLLAEWRKSKGIDPNPMQAYRASGYEARVAAERTAKYGAPTAGGGYA